MKEAFAIAHDGVQVHFVDNEGGDSKRIPLIIVPGMLGIAEHHEIELQELSPRRVIAISHRGLGKSGPISVGQGSFQQRVSDVEAVVRHLELKEYFLYAFSRGVALAVAHALKHKNSIKGMILHDCEPIYVAPSEKWYQQMLSLQKSHVFPSTLEAYWQDAHRVELMESMF
jgi:pimeloyl-ACP methyl ester carboxylesterase